MWVELENSAGVKPVVPNFLVKLSKTPGLVNKEAPMLGEHTEDVLKNLLGYGEEEIQELARKGILVRWKG